MAKEFASGNSKTVTMGKKNMLVTMRQRTQIMAMAMVGCFVVVCAGFGFTTPVQAAGPDAQVTPTAELRDGQAVTVTWAGFTPSENVVIRQCVKDATTAAQCSGGSGIVLEQSTSDGSGFTYFRVVATEGTANTNLPGSDGTKCGPSFPCSIVVTSMDDFARPDNGVVLPITFAPEATSCPTENMNNISGGGSSAVSIIMPSWQLALCQGAGKVSVNYIPTRGDVGGMYDFNCGLVDFAITEIAAKDSDQPTQCGSTVREGIYVPIANSALVFAYSLRNRLDLQFLKSVKLSPDMVAQAMSGQALYWGSHDDSDSINRAIYAVNNSDTPKILNISGDGTNITVTALSNFSVGDQLVLDDVRPAGYNGVYTVQSVTWVDATDHSKGQVITVRGGYKKAWVDGGLINPTNLLPNYVGVFGRADASGLNHLMTRFFLERAADAIHAPGGEFSKEAFSAPSVFMPQSSKLDPGAFKSTQQSIVNSMLGTNDQTASTGAIATMDVATANYYGFPAISIGSTDGKSFVAPTEEAISAGLSEMTSDPTTGVAAANLAPKNQSAYPLVYTVYALVPKYPDSASSMAGIKEMLGYIRDNSDQAKLPSGYVALTTAQKKVITDAIATMSLTKPSPSASPSATPSPDASESSAAIIPDLLPTVPTVIDGGSVTSGGQTSGPGTLVKETSIFAAPFSSHSGAAAAVLPAMLIVGVAASVTSVLRQTGSPA